MTVASTIATDYEYIDGIETVTFTDLDGNATATVKGLRMGLGYRESILVGAGAYQPTDMVWELWSATMASEVPTAGCRITDSGSVVYRILAAQETTIGQTSIKWRCVCRKHES
ncbi:MAG: hypothetical protein WC655_29855 [Candidatus Hydrogenedentales bacterium]|jgi:hypothetical protein